MGLERKLLIVGLDPGITTAYAVLDIDGNPLSFSSSKELSLNPLISEITEYGRVIITGTDKQKIPSLIQEFAAKTGSRVLNPKEDLKVQDKKNMTSGFSLKNDHERDALASALF